MDVSTRQAAEADLAGKAAQYRPDELARYAQRVMDWLHPDGDLTDTERARKRGITLSNQQYDGMSRLSGYLTPQARATFEAVLAKLAAPGATNPDDHTPVIDTTPDAAAIDRDTRSQAQRNHDGLLAGLRALIASGKLGQHNGLPVSIVVTTTLTDLQTGAGKGFTGGGTLLPMADVIRMTSHAHHYSPASGRYPQAIFDHGTPLALYHTKRLASPAQRIMLFANDRGCTKPGCDAPAYHSQAHHVTGWTSTGRTDITELTLACGPDNRLAEKGWTTHNNTHGHTEWLPPPHLDHGQPRSRSSGGYLLDEPPDMTPSFPRTGVSGHAGAVHCVPRLARSLWAFMGSTTRRPRISRQRWPVFTTRAPMSNRRRRTVPKASWCSADFPKVRP